MGRPKYTFEYVKNYIEGKEGNGCKLLSPEYVGVGVKLLIQCKCGETFEKSFDNFKRKGQRQCKKCGYKNGAKNPSHKNGAEKRKNQVVFNCEYCGKENSMCKSHFERYEHHFCNKECMGKWKENQVVFNCEYCDKEKSMKKSIFKKYEHHFCSIECLGKWQSENLRGASRYNYNPNLTQEERERGRKIEGLSQWREDVYERDNYTCQCCGQRGGNLNAHHLNSYNWDKEHRTDINNGVALCKKCHDELHKIYGYGYNTIAQFREFLFNKYTQSHDLKFLALIETIDLTTRAF